MKSSRFVSLLLIVLFLLGITFPFFNDQLELVKDLKNAENRALAKKPELIPARLDPFPAKFDKYYTDHFSLRALLIKWFGLYSIFGLKKSPVPADVILGKNGWLYGAGQEQDCYLGKNRLSAKELEACRLELEYRQQYLAQRNCSLYVMIAPVKAVIYPENMPFEEYRVHPQSCGEQLTAYLTAHSSLKPIDLYTTFRNNKKPYDLYYELDNHWNSAGALCAFKALMKRIRQDFPTIAPTSINDYSIKKIPTGIGNTQNLLGNVVLYKGHDYEILPRQGFKAKDTGKVGYKVPYGFPYPWEFEMEKMMKDSKQPKALFISDSYGKFIFPFMAEKFSRTVKLFDAWQYKLNEDIVNAEKPEVCIVIIHEMLLSAILKYPSRPQHN